MDTLAEGNKSTPCSYVSLMTTAVLVLFCFVLLFFFFQILICNPHVIGNIYRIIPLILMTSLNCSRRNNNGTDTGVFWHSSCLAFHIESQTG